MLTYKVELNFILWERQFTILFKLDALKIILLEYQQNYVFLKLYYVISGMLISAGKLFVNS